MLINIVIVIVTLAFFFAAPFFFAKSITEFKSGQKDNSVKKLYYAFLWSFSGALSVYFFFRGISQW